MGAVDELRRKRFALEPIAKRARKVLGEALRQRRVLNASLVQQSKTGAPLRRAGDLAAVADHVGADGVRETMLGNFWRRDAYFTTGAASPACYLQTIKA